MNLMPFCLASDPAQLRSSPPALPPSPARVTAELDAGRAQDKASNAAVTLKGLEQQLEGLRAEAAELREGGCMPVPVLAAWSWRLSKWLGGMCSGVRLP